MVQHWNSKLVKDCFGKYHSVDFALEFKEYLIQSHLGSVGLDWNPGIRRSRYQDKALFKAALALKVVPATTRKAHIFHLETNRWWDVVVSWMTKDLMARNLKSRNWGIMMYPPTQHAWFGGGSKSHRWHSLSKEISEQNAPEMVPVTHIHPRRELSG